MKTEWGDNYRRNEVTKVYCPLIVEGQYLTSYPKVFILDILERIGLIRNIWNKSSHIPNSYSTYLLLLLLLPLKICHILIAFNAHALQSNVWAWASDAHPCNTLACQMDGRPLDALIFIFNRRKFVLISEARINVVIPSHTLAAGFLEFSMLCKFGFSFWILDELHCPRLRLPGNKYSGHWLCTHRRALVKTELIITWTWQN